ncbi:MAG: substrate-binding domain-containing protein [Anaerolineales bacterium]|nr:substrate-binding domain-containing protein [Anaerolineales bacterium]
MGLCFAGCSLRGSSPDLEIILATTTSTYDSGLLDELVPVFESEFGYVVKIVSVGTGKALKMGEEGNADIILVHAPSAELEFMDQGFGIERTLVMHNDFIIVGPSEDPAGIRGLESPSVALKAIVNTHSLFASRGDDSGTHKKELAFWELSGITPEEGSYLETGQGMGATLQIASEKAVYTLTDRATYLSLQDILDLDVLVEGDMSLLNIYHVILVNPERWPEINLEGGREFANFLVSPQAQTIIENFGIDQYGQPLFTPDAGKEDQFQP